MYPRVPVARIIRIDEAGEAREPRPTLRHELDELRADLRAGIPRKPRDIAAGARQARDVSLADRVVGIDHDDRNGRGRCLGGVDVLVAGGDDDFDLEADDVLSELLECRGASVAPSQLLHDDVLAFDPAEPTQAFLPRLDEQLHVRLDHADPPNSLRRLCLGGEPRGKERARPREECSPVHHLIAPSPRSSGILTSAASIR